MRNNTQNTGVYQADDCINGGSIVDHTQSRVATMHVNHDIQTDAQMTNSTCTATGVKDTVVLHAILPIQVYKKNSNKVVLTYAFYDNGSSGCFMTEDLYSLLQARGTETQLQLRTMHGSSSSSSTVVKDLVISSMDGGNPVELPKVFTREEIPVSAEQIPRPEVIRKWSHLQHVADQIPAYPPDLKIGMLIGTNCPSAVEPLEVAPSRGPSPFATRLHHGWTIYGPLEMHGISSGIVSSNRIVVREIERSREQMTPASALRLLERDFAEDRPTFPDEREMSIEDRRFLAIMESGTNFQNGHYMLPLPFRENDVIMPNNIVAVTKRAEFQKRKMLKNSQYQADYKAFMDSILSHGYAQKVPEEKLKTEEGKVWYLPHHGVYHPKKPGKIRVVFDCSMVFQGTSLNDQLLPGPGLTSLLVGVLTRFRMEPVATLKDMADIESMFYQVTVPTNQRCFLRFLWWPDGKLENKLEEYQMNVHLFGATSSPSVVNFALHLAGDASDNPIVTETIRRNFYVDDWLKSVPSTEIAISLVKDLRDACTARGFRLTKLTSNSHKVLASIPSIEYSKQIAKRDLIYDGLPTERALGVQWDVVLDKLQISVAERSKPATRRGILSVVSSLYDPLGIVAPVILPAKKILQDLCRRNQLDWDEDVPIDILQRWQEWLSELPQLQGFAISRCVKPSSSHIVSRELHGFSDASNTGYGAVVYLRQEDSQGRHHVSFLIGKARLAPLKTTTIPRLELTAAVVLIRLVHLMKQELGEDIAPVYHTDSTTVLRYISNEQRRLPVFVANRVRIIRDFSRPDQWRYVPSHWNPADCASRGLTVQKFVNASFWVEGPSFLQENVSTWTWGAKEEIPDEIEVAVTSFTERDVTMDQLIGYFSDWYRLKRAIAVYQKVSTILKNRASAGKTNKVVKSPDYRITAYDIDKAETTILQWLHRSLYGKEVKSLQGEYKGEDARGRIASTVHRSSSLASLDPYFDNGILRVGGRLRRARMEYNMQHPIILPRKSHISQLIIRHMHVKLAHAGRNHVLSALREKFWIIGGNAAVRSVLASCVICRRLRGLQQEQKMSDLPSCHLDDSMPPFTYTGVDYFGPFLVKDGRKEVKRYGVIFTCLMSRAVHLEISNTLDTDSFINALRRFIVRRGNVKEMHSDNGTNFVGANRELKASFNDMDQGKIQSYLKRLEIQWTFNPPSASHMGRTWERCIRSVRKILSGLLHEHGSHLNTDSLATLLCEVEAILNSRPLSTVSGDPRDIEPLTPNHILTGRSQATVVPPGVFQREDVYARKRWRRVQYLANLFWSRWKNEYIAMQQPRQKWRTPTRNMKTGDIVLVKDETLPRCNWRLGRVTETECDRHGFVRAVNVQTQNVELRRPVHKLVLLVPSTD